MSFLRPRERRTVTAFAEVFIDGGDEALTPEQVAANVDAHLAAIRSSRVKSLRLLLWVIEYLLPLTVLRLRFSRMSARSRRRLIERRITGRRALLRPLAKLRVLFLAGYYDDPAVHADDRRRGARARSSRWRCRRSPCARRSPART